VGRTREYRVLYETWEALKQGRAIHSIVLGDSGVGKSTLVERFSTAASLEGAAVARISAYDLERNIPFATLGGLILGLVDMPGASATPPEALAELARTVPEIRRRYPALPASGESQGETARIRLTESFHQLLQAIAEEHPVILVLDDLHLADEPSLAVLHLALRRATGESILAVFTCRPAELGHSTQAALLRESLSRLHGQELMLDPLDQGQSLELLRVLLESDEQKLSATVQHSLVVASGGFPMVLELLVQDWRAHGLRSVAVALEGMTAEFVSGANPKAAYGHIVSRLTDTLGQAAKSTLDLASVLGHRLNDLSMYSVIDLSLGQTMAALGQLLEIRVLRDGEKGLEFSNELIRAHAYSAIPSPVRRALHASVADRLRQTDEIHEPSSGLEIAWHTMRAGKVLDAIPYLTEGARVAIRSGAPQSAERALSSALGSLEQESLVEATLLLVESLQEQGRWRDSLEALGTLQGVLSTERSQEAFALAGLAKGYLGLSASQELLHTLPTYEYIITSCPHIPSRVRAARAVAHGVSLLRDRTLARRLLPLLDQIPNSDLDVDARGQLSLTRALFLFQAGEAELSFLEADSALKELRSRGAANSVAVQLQSGLGVTRSLQGRYDEAASHYEVALGMANRLGNDSLSAGILANLALVYLRLGRLEGQLWCAEESRRLADHVLSEWSDVILTYCNALTYALCGRASKSREAVASLESRLPPNLPPMLLQRWLLWKADILMVAGARDEALDAATTAVHGYDFALGSFGYAGPFARWVAITSVGTNMEGLAREVVAGLEARVADFDALDQLEILCAGSYLGLRTPGDYAEDIVEKSRLLPTAAVNLIRTLGMTPCI
jgi:tetratricopeptide (TPR) repeat protein